MYIYIIYLLFFLYNSVKVWSLCFHVSVFLLSSGLLYRAFYDGYDVSVVHVYTLASAIFQFGFVVHIYTLLSVLLFPAFRNSSAGKKHTHTKPWFLRWES